MDTEISSIGYTNQDFGMFFRKDLAYGYVAIVQQHSATNFELKIFRPEGGCPQQFGQRFTSLGASLKWASHFVRTEVRYNLIFAYGRKVDDFYSSNFNTREWYEGRETLRKVSGYYGQS